MGPASESERIVRYVSILGRQYPELWKRVDRTREKADWPGWCFMPSSEILKLIGATQSPNQGLSSNLNAVAALASWRVTQGIYKFDPDLFASVWDTPLDTPIPCETLFRLPEWCVYIMTPGCRFAEVNLRGFFAYLDYDPHNGHSELRILLDVGEDQILAALPVDLSGGDLLQSLEASRDRYIGLLNGKGAASDLARLSATDMKQYASMLASPVNLLLYVSSVNAEILDDDGNGPRHPSPQTTRKGIRLFPPKRPAEWQVGFRLGASLRHASSGSYDRVTHDDPASRARPRPHFRRAHWHSFWTGPVNSVEDRNLYVKWIPPILVNVERHHRPIPVFHAVSNRHSSDIGLFNALSFPTIPGGVPRYEQTSNEKERRSVS